MNLIPISKETAEKQSNWHLFISKSFLRLWDSDELQWMISTINSTTNREPTILDLLSHCYSAKIITRTTRFIKWSHQHSEWWCCDGLGLLYCFRTWMTYCNWWHHTFCYMYLSKKPHIEHRTISPWPEAQVCPPFVQQDNDPKQWITKKRKIKVLESASQVQT